MNGRLNERKFLVSEREKGFQFLLFEFGMEAAN